MDRHDLEVGGVILLFCLIIWAGFSVLGSSIYFGAGTYHSETGILTITGHYQGDNSTFYTGYITPLDGERSFNITLSCDYYQSGSQISVSIFHPVRWAIFYPVLWGPYINSTNFEYMTGLQRGC